MNYLPRLLELIALILVTLVPWVYISARQHQIPTKGNVSQTPSIRAKSRTNDSRSEKTIWAGRSGGLSLKWTTADFYVQSQANEVKIWTPLVKTGFEDFVATQKDIGEAARVAGCDYQRTIRVLSVVGVFMSFVDHYYDYCGGAHPSSDTRFTTVDLTKPGETAYQKSEDTPMMNVDQTRSGKIVKLTDYFPKDEIFRALLTDPVVKNALAGLGAHIPATKLADLPELFSENDYELGDSKFELRPDFLTRFVFHHIEDDKVAVRIGLPPHYGFNREQHLQLSLLLPIPATLREALQFADQRKEGFLMKDARRIAGDRITRFAFTIGKDKNASGLHKAKGTN